jgi:hypothetical protein
MLFALFALLAQFALFAELALFAPHQDMVGSVSHLQALALPHPVARQALFSALLSQRQNPVVLLLQD